MMVGRFVILSLLMPTIVRAQVVLGRVIDEHAKAPMRNVTVTIVPDTGSTSVILAKTKTDTLGEFLLDAPAAGQYRLGFSELDGQVVIAPAFAITADQTVQREFVIPARKYYWEFEVEHPVAQEPLNRPPKYPAELRSQGVGGSLLVQFVVDSLGHPDLGTFKVLRTNHPGFIDVVRDWVASARFRPATIDRHRVPQLVQMPFEFQINF